MECTGEEENFLDCAYDLVTSQCSNGTAALQCVGKSESYNTYSVGSIFRQLEYSTKSQWARRSWC